MYEFTYFDFFQIPNKIPRKNKKQSAASTIAIGTKPHDRNEDEFALDLASKKNNVGDNVCAGNVDKVTTNDGQSVAAAASPEIYRKHYSNVDDDEFVSYFLCLYYFSFTCHL